MKTLYIQSRRSVSVRIDGPSLQVTEDGTAPRRYPFRRLARVICLETVHWDAAALAGCLREAIPLTILAPSGQPAGYLLPHHIRASTLSGRLEEFLGRPDWKRLYDNWHRSAERREIRTTLRRIGLWTPDLRPRSVRQLLQVRLAQGPNGGHAAGLVPYLQGLLGALAARVLTEQRLDARLLAGRRPGFHFLADLAALLGWQGWAVLDEFLHRQANPQSTDRDLRFKLTGLHEAMADRETRRARALLDHFSYWMGGLA